MLSGARGAMGGILSLTLTGAAHAAPALLPACLLRPAQNVAPRVSPGPAAYVQMTVKASAWGGTSRRPGGLAFGASSPRSSMVRPRMPPDSNTCLGRGRG